MNKNNISPESIKTELFLILEKTFQLPIEQQQQLVQDAFQAFEKRFQSRIACQDKTTFVERIK